MKVTQYRTQLFLDEERYRWLKEKAYSEGKSIAQVVREVLDTVRSEHGTTLKKRKQIAYKKTQRIIGKGTKGPKDVSVHHDKYLGKALYKQIVTGSK